MTKEPLISIVIPMYNVAKYLPRCLASVTGQTYKNIEIILVDDGSTDGSGSIADDFAKKDKRAQVIHQKNRGLSAARNAGLKKATGEYIAFIDSDDYVEPEYVEKLYLLASKYDADVATCQFEPFSEEKLKLKKTPVWPQSVMTGRESVVDMLANARPAYIWISLFKRSLFIDHGITFPEGRTYEDVATRFQLQYFASKVAFTNEKLYHYLMRRDSITGVRFSKTRFDDLLFAVESIRSFNEKHQVADAGVVDLFDFKIAFLILNYLARERLSDRSLNKYWKKVIKRMRKLYPHVAFPSAKSRIVYTGLYTVAHFRVLYTIMYRLKGVMQ